MAYDILSFFKFFKLKSRHKLHQLILLDIPLLEKLDVPNDFRNF